MRKLTLNRFNKTVDAKFPHELVDLVALPAWVYLGLKKKIGKCKAFEIMRIALLTGGTAAQNLQFCCRQPHPHVTSIRLAPTRNRVCSATNVELKAWRRCPQSVCFRTV